jgi:hypothetical protein
MHCATAGSAIVDDLTLTPDTPPDAVTVQPKTNRPLSPGLAINRFS